MLQTLFKADDPYDRAKADFKAFLEEESVPLQRAFRNYVQSMLDDVTDAQIRSWIENKDLKGFLKFAADYIDEMSDTLPNTFVKAAQQEIKALSQPGVFGTGKLAIDFNPGTPSAAEIIEDSRLKFVKDFTAKQRDAVKAAIDDALRAGKGPAAAARQFRDAIGLTENQWKAVRSYQDLLERGSKQALDRQLRDARFDRTLARVAENDDVLSAKQIERMVGRYTENMRAYRAEVIARTETMRAMNQAKQESWAQMADELGIDPDRVERTWITTLDGKERDTHHDMNRQTVQGLDTPFESPSGEELMYPGDPDASAEETVQCRCTVVVRFPPSPRQLRKAFDESQHPRDEKGRFTVVAYHGTNREFEEFIPNRPYIKATDKYDQEGIYFSGSEQQAANYASMRRRESGGKARVITANLTMDNPLDITNAIKRNQKKGMSFGDAKREAMKGLTPEHDGVIFRGNSVNSPEYVVFSSKQINRITKVYREEDHPRDWRGRWTTLEGGRDKYKPVEGETDAERFQRFSDQNEKAAQASIDAGAYDHPLVKGEYNHVWGASHAGSTNITGEAAERMGISGYKYDPERTHKGLADRFLQAIHDSPGSSEPLYHGFSNTLGMEFKEGDTVSFPLMAAAGDPDTIGYGIHNGRAEQGEPTLFRFPKGTPMAGYARWKKSDSKDFGHVWTEAVVGGKFKVRSSHYEVNTDAKATKYKVVTLEPTHKFNPSNNSWVKL